VRVREKEKEIVRKKERGILRKREIERDPATERDRKEIQPQIERGFKIERERD
jgi:hypothetical protein